MWWELFGWVVGLLVGCSASRVIFVPAPPPLSDPDLDNPCPVCAAVEDVDGAFTQCCECGGYVCGACSAVLFDMGPGACPLCRDGRWGDSCVQDLIELMLRRHLDPRVTYGAAYTAAVHMRLEGNREGERKFLRLSALQGNPKAAEELGEMILTGVGGPKSRAEGRQWLAKANTPRALELLRAHAKPGSTTEILALLSITSRSDASQGLLAATYHRLAELMDPIEPSRAIKFFVYAATLGDADAMARVARALCTGTGIKRNPSIGALWYRQAAKLGNTEARCVIGLVDYSRGDDDDVDDVD